MQYLPIMNVLQSQTYLSEPIKNVILTPILQLTTCLFLLLILVFNSSLKISTIRVVHNNTELSLFCFVYFTESYNIWMLQDLEYLGLPQSLSSLILIHVLNIDLLDNCVSFIGLAFNQVCCTKRANTQCLNFLVSFILLLGWL